jgi:hypothetical protein
LDAKLSKSRHNLVTPHLLVPVHIVTQHLAVVLLHKPSPYKTQHLKVHLNLDKLVIHNAPEQAVRTILNLHEDPRPILLLLDPINFATNYKLGLTQRTDVQVVEGVITNQTGSGILGDLVGRFVL